jgi:hypothetical protein
VRSNELVSSSSIATALDADRSSGECGIGWEAGLTGKEAVKLDKDLQVHVVALRSLAVRVTHMVAVEIDTC